MQSPGWQMELGFEMREEEMDYLTAMSCERGKEGGVLSDQGVRGKSLSHA